MQSLRNMVVDFLHENNGASDEEIAYVLRQFVPSTQAVSLICRQLESEGVIKRIKRIGKPSGNYVVSEESQVEKQDVAAELGVQLPNSDELPDVPKGQEHILELQQIGFIWVGDFTLSGNGISYFVGDKNDLSDILIALTIDGAVVHLCNSQRSLGQTLAMLTSNAAPAHMQKYSQYLRSTLQRDRSVQIYVLRDPGGLHYVGHRLSLCAGLFPTLVEHFRPVWNKNVSDMAA